MEKEIYGYIYLIKNTVNGKLYFGQTVSSFKERYCGNVEKYTHNIHLKNSIGKYGIENFEIVEEFDTAFSKEELDSLENMYIKLYNTIDEQYGYNKRHGGAHGRLSEASKKKISLGQTGENSHVAVRVVCLNTGEIFSTSQEAADWGEIDRSSVIKCCKGKRKFAGKKNREQLQWRYLEDYQAGTRVFKGGLGQYICLNNQQVFFSLQECATYGNVFESTISRSLKNQRKHGGFSPHNSEPLYWMRYDEFLMEIKRKDDEYGK